MTGFHHVGGYTTSRDKSAASIANAVSWLKARPPNYWPSPIVHELEKLFSLTAAEAEVAIREANRNND